MAMIIDPNNDDSKKEQPLTGVRFTHPDEAWALINKKRNWVLDPSDFPLKSPGIEPASRNALELSSMTVAPSEAVRSSFPDSHGSSDSAMLATDSVQTTPLQVSLESRWPRK